MPRYKVICPHCGYAYPKVLFYKPRLKHFLICSNCNKCFKNSFISGIFGGLIAGSITVTVIVLGLTGIIPWSVSIVMSVSLISGYLLMYPFIFNPQACDEKTEHKRASFLFLAQLTCIAVFIAYCIFGAAPLIVASALGSGRIVNYMVAIGADPNVRNDGITSWMNIEYPLEMAVLSRNKKGIETLIKNGAHIEVQNSKGYAPIHLAVLSGDKDALSLLISNGADPDRMYMPLSVTPLMIAADNGYHEIADLLIKSGARVNIMGKLHWNMTPLMLAAQNCHREAVRVLISAGADATVSNEIGETAFHYGEKCKDQDMMRLLYEGK